MKKAELKECKKQLEKEKKRLTKELKSFARQDKKIKGNWLTRFPLLGNDRSHKDENAEEVETYQGLLSVEYTLEERLKKINQALEKIKKNKYGICDNCKKEIEVERLKIVPEATHCIKCGAKK